MCNGCGAIQISQPQIHIRLDILDTLLANQTAAKGMLTIACRIETRKMAEC